MSRPDKDHSEQGTEQERRYHIAGTLGTALARRLFDLEWITRSLSSRAVRLTPDGQRALQAEFDIRF